MAANLPGPVESEVPREPGNSIQGPAPLGLAATTIRYLGPLAPRILVTWFRCDGGTGVYIAIMSAIG